MYIAKFDNGHESSYNPNINSWFEKNPTILWSFGDDNF